MQKKLIVAAVAGALAAPLAIAQSNVTIYGIADVGVEWGDSGFGNKFRVQSGQASGSRLGFKGSEDLGGGLKANFTLEMGFALDNGQLTTHNSQTGNAQPGAAGSTVSNTAPTTTGTVIFARQAWAGLSGNFGEVNLGRQYTPLFWVLLNSDPVGAGTGATPFNLYLLGPHTTTLNTQSSRRARSDNSITYKTPTFGGFNAMALYSTGNENNVNNTAEDDGREWGVNATWAGGPIWVGLGYQNIDGAVGAGTQNPETKNWALGASYKFGMAKLFASYNAGKGTDNTGAEVQKANVWSIGANINAGPGYVSVTYTDLNDKLAANADARLFGIGYNYPLSKRTDVYAFWSTIRNKSNSNYTIGSAVATNLSLSAAGEDPKALQLGIRHAF
ncbi:MAG: porin [Pseudomonadota bacterium]